VENLVYDIVQGIIAEYDYLLNIATSSSSFYLATFASTETPTDFNFNSTNFGNIDFNFTGQTLEEAQS
jgi:hypothetical protein